MVEFMVGVLVELIVLSRAKVGYESVLSWIGHMIYYQFYVYFEIFFSILFKLLIMLSMSVNNFNALVPLRQGGTNIKHVKLLNYQE